MIVTLLFFISCKKGSKPELTKSIETRNQIPQLFADSITTIVSDSGIIRYRVTAPQWYVYDKTDTPYWDFPFGLRFERFDNQYSIDAEIECQKGIFYSELELWKLNGNVKAINLTGEEFYTEELFWDQKNQTVFSDSSITIVQKGQTIYGVGFHSNQTFSKYHIKKPKGAFPIEDN